jgi:hypothetical protein
LSSLQRWPDQDFGCQAKEALFLSNSPYSKLLIAHIDLLPPRGFLLFIWCSLLADFKDSLTGIDPTSLTSPTFRINNLFME